MQVDRDVGFDRRTRLDGQPDLNSSIETVQANHRQSTTPTAPDRGLGLCQARDFAEPADKLATVCGQKSAAAAITQFLSCCPKKTESDQRQEADRQRETTTSKVILVVDDELDMRDLLTSMLEKLGYVALTAGSDREALDLLQRTARVDLVLCDYILSAGRTGRDLAAAMQDSWPELPVVFMSGYSDALINDQTPDQREIPSIAKPFTFRKLSAMLAKLLGQETGG